MDFKQFLIEISKKELESLDLERSLHFDKIFKDKLRILIPLESDRGLNYLIKAFEENGYVVDYEDLVDKKIVYKPVTTQQGTKNRPEKVGGILQSWIKNAKHPENLEEYKKLLDWWQKNSGNLKNNEVGSSIIVSRSPIDLVRMSDHDGITSCHSPSGSYFKCARQEAKTGGAVAYVVKNSDIKGLDLQKPEIFEDKQRKVSGIVPLERIRLRRFTNGSLDLLLPELRTYGIKNVGFLDAVSKWAQTSQKDAIDQIDPEKDYAKFDLAGGSYQDTKADKIWSTFFSKQVIGSKQSIHADDEDEDDNDNLEQRAERQLEEHQASWKNVHVSLDFYDDILSYSAWVGFQIPVKLFEVDLGDRKVWREVKEVIENAIDIYSIESMEVQQEGRNYQFSFSFYEEDSYERDQLVRFEHFLDYVDSVDSGFEDHVNKVYTALIDKGYLKSVIDKIEFDNFNMERDEDGTTISSEPEKIGYLKDYPIAAGSGYYGSSSVFERNGKIYLSKLTSEIHSQIQALNLFPFKISEKEMKIFMQAGMTQGRDNPTKATSGTSEKQGQPPIYFLTGWAYFEFSKSLGNNMVSDTNSIKRLRNFDKNWDFYIGKLAKVFDMFIKRDMQAFAQMHPNIRDVEHDNDWGTKLSNFRSQNKLPQQKLPSKPYPPPKSPYQQKRFKFESFKNWILNRS